MPRLLSILCTAFVLGACGGAFDSDDDDDGGGQAGNPGGAGSSAGPNGSCVWGGNTYENGETFAENCNSCSCSDGRVSCTLLICGISGCTYEGVSYLPGESFPAADGCNTCSCESGGVVTCTELGCASCEIISEDSAIAVELAKQCDSDLAEQCTQVVAGQLDCGCPTYVNPENEAAIAALAAAHEQYSALMCGPSPCDCASPTSAYCATNGQCVDSYDGGLAACRVNDQVYPSGSSGFTGPLGCNTCFCDDGQLICTEEACPSACPPNAVSGSHCAQCGPTDGCEIVEYTCLEVCTDTCDVGVCIDGVCRNVCG